MVTYHLSLKKSLSLLVILLSNILSLFLSLLSRYPFFLSISFSHSPSRTLSLLLPLSFSYFVPWRILILQCKLQLSMLAPH
ncbi:MAG: hypothetical protein BYD32DRAFT_422147 [Podila humilis]|nr:MAG: hypothetical protein BYD32DRAFT_422147 [Podila humilis]